MSDILNWVNKKLKLRSHLSKVESVEYTLTNMHLDSFGVKHLRAISLLISVNSILFCGYAFTKMGLCIKSLALLAIAGYVNVAWMLYGESEIVKQRMMNSCSLPGLWHREYLR